MNFFDDQDNMVVNFSITQGNVTHSLNAEFEDDTPWPHILDKVLCTLESAYGYSFDLHWETEKGTAGIYYPGKKDYAE